MSLHNVFRSRIPRHAHNISERQYFDMDMGVLIPTYVRELYPGDTVKISSSALLETRTLSAPLKNNIKMREYWFFVPRRLMWKDWEKFIFGGRDGNFTANFPYIGYGNQGSSAPSDVLSFKSLWDYFGLPVSSTTKGEDYSLSYNLKVDAMLFAAYQMIYKDWFRDENFSNSNWDFENGGLAWLSAGNNLSIKDESGNTLSVSDVGNLLTLRHVPWSRTYFTAALPFRQRGNANRVPLHGTAPLKVAVKHTDSGGNVTWSLGSDSDLWKVKLQDAQSPTNKAEVPSLGILYPGDTVSAFDSQPFDQIGNNGKWFGIDGANLQGFTITELRLLAKLQEFEEINARFGFRYIEGLRGHFGVSPTDSRLDRPEFIGGRSQDVIISEILQTSETSSTPLGTPAGRGVSGSANRIGKYFAEEHGILMCVMSILPEQIYTQGCPRMWTRRTKEEFFSPEFNGLSEQEIREQEVYATGSMTDSQLKGVFGFVPAWEELRHGKNIAKGNLRNSSSANDLFAWTQARSFSSAPVLGENFIMADQSNSNGGVRTDAWTTGNSVSPFFVSAHYKVKLISTVSASGTPGITRI